MVIATYAGGAGLSFLTVVGLCTFNLLGLAADDTRHALHWSWRTVLAG